MPKVKIDYSNTVFYKIYCKDTNVNELYIGHTTNFVQRKHAHKQSCSNLKSTNYKCKLYDVIRQHNGWDNWNMEMIAFHNCNDLYEAKKYEQQYFEDLKATLNSIEPLPKPKANIVKDIVKKEKPIIFCKLCNITFQSLKEQETHNKRKKHIRNTNRMNLMPNNSEKYYCEKCNFKCSKLSNYNKHLLTLKHKNITISTSNEQKNAKKCQTKFICECGKEYGARNSLWYHKKKCFINEGNKLSNTSSNIQDIDKEFMVKMVLQNQEFMNKIIEMIPQIGNITK